MKVFVILSLFLASTLATNCVGAWGAWGACTGACGAQGTSTRYYAVQIAATDYGTPCPFADYESQTQPCAKACPENDCVGSWVDQGACVSNGVCGSDAGKQTRVFQVTKAQGPGGAACATAAGATQEIACSAPVTPCVACVGHYDAWTTCQSNGVCGSDAGTQTRSYTVDSPAGPGGAACPAENGHTETRACAAAVTPCVHCEGAFENVGGCVSDGTCGSAAGKQSQKYKVTQAAGPGGYACPHPDGFEQQVACAAPVTPCVDCVGSWSGYTDCVSNGVCGSDAGKHTRKFTVQTPAGPGGRACEAANDYVETSACPAAVTPCKGCVGSWSYTECQSNGVCGSDAGKRTRTYAISEPGEAGGVRCEAANGYSEQVACSAPVTPCAAVDCAGHFENGGCEANSCGTTEGKAVSTFKVDRAAAYGGKACDYADGHKQTVACEAVNKPCAVGCVGSWETISACESNGVCGSSAGHRSLKYTITTPAAYGGANCPAANGATKTENCNDAPVTACPPEDGVGSWTWTGCKARGCGTTIGDRSATFSVSKPARYGGKPCEAENGAVRTEECVATLTPCPVACIGEWTHFSTCATKGQCSSPAGTQSRTYSIKQAAAFGGAECSAKDGQVETRDCNEATVKPCPPVPCKGSWQAAPCSQTACGASAGTSVETFAVTQQEKYDGTPCEAANGDKRTVACSVEQVKPCPINCVGKYDETNWNTCKPSAACGTTTGSQTRKFEVTTKAQFGGIECPVADGTVENRDCTVPLVKCPPVNCVGSYSEFTPCVQTKCDVAAGTQSRLYSIQIPAKYEGTECPYKHGETVVSACEVTADKLTHCPIDCAGEFDAPTECKAIEECGCPKGTQTRTFVVKTKAQFGGKVCEFQDGQKVAATCLVDAKKVKHCPDPVLDAPCDDLRELVIQTQAARCKIEAIVAALEKK